MCPTFWPFSTSCGTVSRVIIFLFVKKKTDPNRAFIRAMARGRAGLGIIFTVNPNCCFMLKATLRLLLLIIIFYSGGSILLAITEHVLPIAPPSSITISTTGEPPGEQGSENDICKHGSFA